MELENINAIAELYFLGNPSIKASINFISHLHVLHFPPKFLKPRWFVVFQRRDSFITHRAFCDALAFASSDSNVMASAAAAGVAVASSALATVPLSPALSIQSSGNIKCPLSFVL